MKKFARFVVILALLLGFSWFAWDKVESHANNTLVKQIEQLTKELEAANSRSEKWKSKFFAFKELMPKQLTDENVSSNGVTTSE